MTHLIQLFRKYRVLIFYAFLMGILVFALKWLEWKFLIVNHSLEIYIGLLAVFFTVFGVWVASHFLKPRPKTIIVEKEILVPVPEEKGINESELKKLNLSSREYEVLQLLSKGYSNAEIAEKLFLSLSTVKTHASNLFLKMDVKSRTQAIEKAKRLKITE